MSDATVQQPLTITAMTAAAYVGNVGGGNRRAIRGIGVISVALAELPADIKCHFSALLP